MKQVYTVPCPHLHSVGTPENSRFPIHICCVVGSNKLMIDFTFIVSTCRFQIFVEFLENFPTAISRTVTKQIQLYRSLNSRSQDTQLPRSRSLPQSFVAFSKFFTFFQSSKTSSEKHLKKKKKQLQGHDPF